MRLCKNFGKINIRNKYLILLIFIFSSKINAAELPIDAGKLEKNLENIILEPKSKFKDFQVIHIESKKPDESEDIEFKLSKIIITGNNVFTEEELSKNYKNLIGKNISLAKVYDIADQISIHYKRQGYVLSKAIVPLQSIKNGIVKLQIIEGNIGKITYDNNFKPTNKIEEIVRRIKFITPFNVKQLEKHLLLIKNLGGYTIKSTLKKLNSEENIFLEKPETTELILSIEKKKNHANISINNLGSKYTSLYSITSTYNAINLILPHHETTFIAVTDPKFKNMKSFSVIHEMPLNTQGTKFIFNVNTLQAVIGQNLKIFGIKSKFTSGGFKFSHSIMKFRNQDLTLNLNFTRKRNVLRSFGTELTDDIYNLGSFGMRYDFSDKFNGINLIELNHNIIFKADKNKDFSHDGNFTNMKISRIQNVSDNIEFFIAGLTQKSRSKLPSNEQFYYGNLNYGIAYDQNNVFSDYGISSLFEIRYKNLFNNIKILKDSYIFSSIDSGRFYSNSQIPSINVSSIIFGLKGSIDNYVKYNLSLSRNLKAPVNAKKDYKIGFLVSTNL